MTKKYAAVYTPLVERLQAEEGAGRAGIKAVKTKLHQLYGAYTQDNAHKKAAVLIAELESDGESGQAKTAAAAKKFLTLHASTKERLPYYTEFYDFILYHCGQVKSVLDIGCGYNPFSIPLIPEAWPQFYYAYDIDTRVADLLNRFFVYLNMPPLAQCADLAVHIPQEPVDIALMCKLLPVLEAQSPGSGYRLARELNTRHLLITYPIKSLGGREKGMARHYSAAFENALSQGELGKFMLVCKKQIGHEMLFFLSAIKDDVNE